MAETTLYVDPEHDGIRYAVLGFLLAGGTLAFLAIRAFFPDPLPDYATLVSCVGAIPIAFALSWIGENFLKRTWRSGRSVTLAPTQITLKSKEKETQVVVDEGLDVLLWHFSLKGYARSGRERRLQRDWWVLACQIAGGKTEIMVYTYVSPRQMKQFVQNHTSFHEIFPKDVLDTSFRDRVTIPTDLKIPNKALLGPNGRYWRAEKKRWTHGAELQPDDFKKFITFINQ